MSRANWGEVKYAPAHKKSRLEAGVSGAQTARWLVGRTTTKECAMKKFLLAAVLMAACTAQLSAQQNTRGGAVVG
ncbi:MAG: hypothetical protein ACK5Z0_01205, partial [Planctomycetota bacterium]